MPMPIPIPWYQWTSENYSLLRPPPCTVPVRYDSGIPNTSSVVDAEHPNSAYSDKTTKSIDTEKESFLFNESTNATSDYESSDSGLNILTEHTLESENDFLAIIKGGEDKGLREREAVENQLKKILNLSDNSEDEDENFVNLSNLTMTPRTRINKLSANVEEFIPKNESPKVESLITESKVSQNTVSTLSEEIAHLNEIRAFVMQQQMKNA